MLLALSVAQTALSFALLAGKLFLPPTAAALQDLLALCRIVKYYNLFDPSAVWVDFLKTMCFPGYMLGAGALEVRRRFAADENAAEVLIVLFCHRFAG